MPRSCEQALKAPFSPSDNGGLLCQHAGCAEMGSYRAPVARDRPSEFYRFCLEHVRAYNKAWDYYRGMSISQIEAERERDATWQRPTWRLGGHPAPPGATEEVFDPLDLLGKRAKVKRKERQRRRSEEEKALDLLGLSLPCGFDQVRQRYKELAKRLHPDANGGDRVAEEQLKVVNQAYTTLKAFYA